MKINDTVPTDWAEEKLLKAMPPGPSIPASIPSPRKPISAGSPKRLDRLPASTVVSSKMPTSSSADSVFKFSMSGNYQLS